MQNNESGNAVVANTPRHQQKPKRKQYAKVLLGGVAIALVMIITSVAMYNLGYSKGTKDQKIAEANKLSQAAKVAAGLPGILENRWSVVGTVENISADSISVKNNKGSVQEAALNSDTEITLKPSRKTDVSSIKKGAKVIVLGTKGDDGKVTATMIRIQ